jgi:hypothetical protein
MRDMVKEILNWHDLLMQLEDKRQHPTSPASLHSETFNSRVDFSELAFQVAHIRPDIDGLLTGTRPTTFPRSRPGNLRPWCKFCRKHSATP